jgi:thioredoxin 2
MIRRCANCGRPNRIPAARLADTGRCGACGQPLGPAGEPLDVTAAEHDEIVGAARVPVLIDFWAAWCGPCKAAAPEVARAAASTSGRALVLKVDTEKEPELAARYGVRNIPNFVVLKDGQVVGRHAGVVGHDRLEAWLEQARS